MLSTENVDIQSGVAWTKISNTGLNFSVQNNAEVLMEYSFTDGISKGSYLTPYTLVHGIRQDIFIRFYNVNQNGSISITRET